MTSNHPVAIILLFCLFPVVSFAQVESGSGGPFALDGGGVPSDPQPAEEGGLAAEPLTHEGEHVSEAYTLGERYLREKAYEEAYEHLLRAFREEPGNLRVNFALGRAAFEVGDYEAAVMAFERILIARPDLRRVKLELARSYFGLKSYEIAKRYFEEVSGTELPENVRHNIEAFLTQIDIFSKRHFLSGMFGFGYGWDSNVHANCDRDEVETIAGGQILCPTDRDTVFDSTLILEHKFRLVQERDLWWQSSLAYYSAFYDDESDEDLTYISLLTGPAIETPHWTVLARALLTYLEEGGHPYLRSYGGVVGAVRELNDSTLLVASAKAEERKFHQERDKTGFNLGGSIGPTFVWGSNRLMNRFGLEHNDARAAMESYDNVNALIRYERDMPRRITLSAGYRFDYYDYEGPDARFGKTRRDRLHEFSVGLTKKLWGNLSVELGHTYTRSGSSIEIYDHDRHRTRLSFRLTF